MSFRTWNADLPDLSTEDLLYYRAQRDRIRAQRREAQAQVRAARAERDARATVAAGFRAFPNLPVDRTYAR